MTDGTEPARAYYRALDEGEYDRLADLLTEGFVHDRPDRTLEGRDRFVTFMREERPQTDTSHRVDTVFTAEPRPESETDAAVQGRLLAADGSAITDFVDVFSVCEAGIERIETYSD